MKINTARILLFSTFVLSLILQPAFSKERNIIWGDFFFDMKRKEAINVLQNYCKNIMYETKVRIGITAEACKFPQAPFSSEKTSVDLVFGFALTKNNKRLRYIVFQFDDFNKTQLTRLYSYSHKTWFISRNWRCNSPFRLSSVGETVQLCGASFNDDKIRLTSTVAVSDGDIKDLKNRTSRKTRMYFYAFQNKNPYVGNP